MNCINKLKLNTYYSLVHSSMLVIIIRDNHAKLAHMNMMSFHELYIVIRSYAMDHGGSAGAGAIMALAFSGLFFSEKLLHQQFALLLVTSVLLDTYVVRTVLVPALMMSAGDYNWWPRKMPKARR